ncbi:hypothetical protein GCM10010441_10430 [Kitasatospora paracochleata]
MQGERFASGLLVHWLQLEHRGGAVRPDDRKDQRDDPVGRRTVRSQVPAVQEALRQGGQGGDPCPPEVTTMGGGQRLGDTDAMVR